MVMLPASTAPAAAWGVYDYTQTPASADADAVGVATAVVGPVPQDELWLVDRLVVSSDSSVRPEVRVYLDDPSPARLVDGTSAGDLDIAEYPAALLVPGTSTLLVQWTGADAGAACSARVQLRILRREG